MENKVRFERGYFAERSTVIKGVQPEDVLIRNFTYFLKEFEGVKIKEKEVRNWLKQNGFLVEDDNYEWIPSHISLENGLMRCAVRDVGPNEFKRTGTPYITPEGVEYFTKKIKGED